MIETGIALEGAAASLSLLEHLIELIRTARAEGKRLTVADVLERLPSEGSSVAAEIIDYLEKLETALIKANVDLAKTSKELQSDRGWFFQKKYKLIDKFDLNIRAKFLEANHLLEDFVAVAHCREAEDLVASTFAQANEAGKDLESSLRDEKKSIGDKLKALLEHARRLRAAFLDLHDRKLPAGSSA